MVSPLLTRTVLAEETRAGAFLVVVFFGVAFLAVALLAPGLVFGFAVLLALPLLLVRPALRLQTGQAPGPWEASTRRAIAICSALLARFARDAYLPQPKPFQ